MGTIKALAIDSVTLTDLTDAIVSVEEPINPANGTLWIDISEGEEEGVLKQYIIREGEDKGQWVTVKLNMDYLNPELAETVKSVNKQLTIIGDDGLLNYNERVELSKLIAEITGESPSTTTSMTVGYTNSLPTPLTLDSGSNGGTFYKYRYSARQVGINQEEDRGNPIYANLEHAYNELNDYLSQFKPKPWDITLANKDKVVELGDTADRLREVFLNYYTSALALSELTKERGVEVSKKYTDEGIDNISIGGTNLISNDKSQEGKSLDSKGNEISNILYNTSDFIEVVGGKEYTMSIFVTPQTSNEFIKYAWYDSNRTFISSGGITDTSKTIKAPENAKYIRIAYLKDTKPKFETGNKPTDWSPNPDDIESQIEHTQASLTVTANAIRGIVLETIGGSEVATIDEETGEIIYVDTGKTRLSQIEQTASSISTSVSENTGAIAKIEQTASSISTSVSENTGAIAKIEQTANSLSTKVSSNTGAIAKIEQTANSLSTKVSSNTGAIAKIEQTANSLSTKVSSNTGAIAKVEQTVNSISSTVSNNTSSISSIRQTASSIRATVTNNAKGSTIVNSINLNSGGVRISGNRIAVTGDTTFSNNVKISGNLIVGGSITQANINLPGGYISSSRESARIQGSTTGFDADSDAFTFDYGSNSFEVQGRIGANPEGNRHAIELNGLTLHGDRGSFKSTSSGYELRSSGELNLKATTVKINGKEIYDNGKGGWASR